MQKKIKLFQKISEYDCELKRPGSVYGAFDQIFDGWGEFHQDENKIHYCVLNTLHKNSQYVKAIISIHEKYISHIKSQRNNELSKYIMVNDIVNIVIDYMDDSISISNLYKIIDEKINILQK